MKNFRLQALCKLCTVVFTRKQVRVASILRKEPEKIRQDRTGFAYSVSQRKLCLISQQLANCHLMSLFPCFSPYFLCTTRSATFSTARQIPSSYKHVHDFGKYMVVGSPRNPTPFPLRWNWPPEFSALNTLLTLGQAFTPRYLGIIVLNYRLRQDNVEVWTLQARS